MKFLNLDIRRARPRAINTVFKEHFAGKMVRGAEIGVWKGENAKEILGMLNIYLFYLIDPYKDYKGYDRVDKDDLSKIKSIAHKNLADFRNIAWVEEHSNIACNCINELDLVYIDGNHSYESAFNDISSYYPKVATGGIIAGDDIETEGVRKAVFDFARTNNLDVRIAGRSWYILK